MFEKIKKLFHREDCAVDIETRGFEEDPLMLACLYEAMKGNVVHATRDDDGKVTMTSVPMVGKL